MAILDGDIQLLKSEVLDDVPEGGGMATGNAVVDGASNNLFPDISELDRTIGRVALRKVFPAVVTDDVDTYYGAHVIVAEPPADAKVSVALFSTGSFSDRRSAAQDRLESYLSASAEGRWMLYGNHLAGQRAVQMHCASSAPTPAVDDVLMLISSTDSSQYQYVRISRLIERRNGVEFEDAKGVFTRDVISVEISDALRYGFSAAPLERYTTAWYAPPTRIHTTVAADAANYYGVQPLRLAAALGDLTVRAQSIYTQLVPSALSETPIVDARCASDRTVIVPIDGAPALSFSTTLSLAAGVPSVRYFGRSIARGSVSIDFAGATLIDDGNGALVPTAGLSGSVDYETGSVAITRNTSITGLAIFNAAPAAAVASAGHTAATDIGVGNRGYSYVKTLNPAPAPGSVAVSFMAQGKWYSLYDDAAGNISGDEGSGVGIINYATGALLLTLGALPDVDTAILFAWGSPAHYTPHVGGSIFAAPAIELELAGGAIEPGSLSIHYLAGGISRAVTDNGLGALQGAASGRIEYGTGRLRLYPAYLPDAGSNLEIDYEQGSSTTEAFAADGVATSFTLSSAVKPGSVTAQFLDTGGFQHTLRDNGAGGLVVQSSIRSVSGGGFSTTLESVSGVSGSVNYATGAVTIGANITTRHQYQTGYTWASSTASAEAVGIITVSYRAAGDAVGGPQSETVAVPALVLELLPTVANTLLPGSISFSLAGETYVDRAGTLVKSVDPATNSGFPAGSINYSSGKATLTDYIGGSAPALSVSALTRKGTWSDWQIRFRTAGAPLQSASLYISAIRADTGATLSATADSSGAIAAALVSGSVDVSTGVVELRFGQMVAAAGNEGQWWYDPADVVAGQIFKPTLVYPDTARYNAVVTASLPLSAAVLGLDPVRLPADGRVPIFRAGDAVVVHHAATTAPVNVSAGQTVNLGRVRLARVRVIGNDGATITTGYSHDLDAGAVTFSSVAGYSQPVRIEHRIEDMALVTDVQINGDLAISRPLTHDFPLGSYVSSALIIGDMHARVSAFFDQQTWTGWYDTLQGLPATGTYNALQYPPVVTNRGAIDERWSIVFTNTTTVNVIGETVGQIVTAHNIAEDLAPINPAQGVPYFTLDARGWGSGWSAGNVLRKTTRAASYPVWCVRTVLQGNPTTTNDHFAIAVRGDVDA